MEGKIHLVKWEVVCTDKDKGGLGLRKLALYLASGYGGMLVTKITFGNK